MGSLRFPHIGTQGPFIDQSSTEYSKSCNFGVGPSKHSQWVHSYLTIAEEKKTIIEALNNNTEPPPELMIKQVTHATLRY